MSQLSPGSNAMGPMRMYIQDPADKLIAQITPDALQASEKVAKGLQAVAKAIIAAVREIDVTHGLSEYMKSVSVEVLADGQFNLVINPKEGVDMELVGYCMRDPQRGIREQRVIELEDDNYETTEGETDE